MLQWLGLREMKAKKIGEGSHSLVYIVEHPEYGKVAAKVINLRNKDSNLVDLLKNEWEHLKKLDKDSEYFVKVMGQETDGDFFIIYLELCYFDLYKFIEKFGCLNEEQAIQVFKPLSMGLQLLHQNKILHRDIKPENILIQCSQDDYDKLDNRTYNKEQFLSKCKFKLGDFGVAKLLEEKELADSIAGTGDTMAPEVRSGEKYGFESDVYSMGRVFYYILHGKYKTANIIDARKDLNKDLLSTVLYMLNQEPNKRANAKSVHDFFWIKRQNTNKTVIKFIKKFEEKKKKPQIRIIEDESIQDLSQPQVNITEPDDITRHDDQFLQQNQNDRQENEQQTIIEPQVQNSIETGDNDNSAQNQTDFKGDHKSISGISEYNDQGEMRKIFLQAFEELQRLDQFKDNQLQNLKGYLCVNELFADFLNLRREFEGELPQELGPTVMKLASMRKCYFPEPSGYQFQKDKFETHLNVFRDIFPDLIHKSQIAPPTKDIRTKQMQSQKQQKNFKHEQTQGRQTNRKSGK